MAVVLIGTLDTKGRELAFVRDLLRGLGLETIVIDAGSLGPPTFEADIGRQELVRLYGLFVDGQRAIFRNLVPTLTDDAAWTLPEGWAEDRGSAVGWMASMVTRVVADLHASGRVDGVFGLGGSAGTVIATSAMRGLPIGLPKVMVSTLASGQTRPFVGGSANAAHALAGMVKAPKLPASPGDSRPVVAATMFGVTTPCVDRAREHLEAQGCEVLVFHATGVGGQSMEALIASGLVDAVLDLTTTELADELVGGILSAGPERLRAARRRGIPQVVSVGALDMVNFGHWSTVPARFSDRLFHQHNDSVTLMRTTPAENARLGQEIGLCLSGVTADTVVMLPLGGISALDAPGMPFHDPEADAALFAAIHEALDDHPKVTVVDRPYHINDPTFALQCALALQLLMSPDPAAETPLP
jgi:uncharacterized protein (UPF0261 family)